MADIGTAELRKKIKGILKGADLDTLSAKKVRIKLQELLDIDLSDRKKEIDQMTMSLILEMQENKGESDGNIDDDDDDDDDKGNDDDKESDDEKPEKNGKESDSEKEDEVNKEEEEPPKKKSKSSHKSKSKDDTPKKKKKKSSREKMLEDLDDLPECDDLNVYDEEQKTLKLSDEELAKRLQSFEETGRRTRRAAAPKKKERKKKDGGTSAYSKPCFLSPELAEIMGTDKLARNEVVKKMWEIVRERKLKDPKDGRFMLCDDQLLKIFVTCISVRNINEKKTKRGYKINIIRKKRIQTFGMMKYLTSHIRDEGPSLESVMNNSDIYDDEAADD